MRISIMVLTVAAVAAGVVVTAQPLAIASEPPSVKREIIPGSELMTSQEREQYRQRIRAAGSPREEERVRADHLKQMRERARLHGLQLPEPGERK